MELDDCVVIEHDIDIGQMENARSIQELQDDGDFRSLSLDIAMVTAALAGHSLLSEFGERGITVAGSAFLILGHVRNQHLCSHDHCHDHDAITESHHHN